MRLEGLLTAIQWVHTHNYIYNYMPLELYMPEVGVVRCLVYLQARHHKYTSAKYTRSRAFLRSRSAHDWHETHEQDHRSSQQPLFMACGSRREAWAVHIVMCLVLVMSAPSEVQFSA